MKKKEDNKAAAEQKDTWVKRRHRVIRRVLGPFIKLLCVLLYGVRIEKYSPEEGAPCLVLYNHQTPFDQFFVSLTFKEPVYHVATEDIFSIGRLADLLRWLVAPIPIKKQAADLSAIRTMRQVAKEGGIIALAPEGNRTYSGKTEYINPSVAKLIRLLKLPVALCRIEGGYGVQPRWSDRTRRGTMRSYVSEIISPEKAAKMSNEELYDRIRNGLFVNEAVSDRKFFSARRAEYLERAVYVCPFCGLAAFRSRGNVTECLTCHRRVRYHTDKHLSGEGYKFPFRYVNDWYEYQNTFVRGLPLSADTEHTIRSGEWFFKDEGVGIFEVIPYKKKKALLGDASVQLHADGISISAEGQTRCIPFRDVDSAAVLGRNKLNVYYQDRIWQFKGKKRFNALKYLNFIYRFKQGESDGEFLGL
ncbi:MAG: 1-acyl-sn-glycerol-3-phosphate acyltransferase [Lachnospiraceae bacterium]|nr:1-acyl-sn-glycerol-3-phosphate acyltransferase [Lachnospiraceae bacterium]